MAKRPIRNNKPNLQTKKAQNARKANIVKKRVFTKPQVQDARQKLIQRKLSTVKDARDVLAKIAKGQDARNKLNKLRQKRSATANGNIKVIGQNIVQKIDKNGKISLVTNKSKSSTGINATIQKELGLVTSPKKAVVRRALAASRVPPTVHTAVLNEIDSYNQMLVRTYDPSLYKWSKPGMRTTASQLIGSLEGRVRGAKGEVFQGWQNFPINKPLRSPHGFIDLDAVDDEEMPMAPIAPIKQTITLQGSSRISNIHSRLDSPIEQDTHGIFGQPKTKVVVPAGHRIVVSNLQSTVTQDDVKELFEDIGQLLAARLVRPGVAEVIYKNLKDAQKAVDTYHNRQLDGQPMKCLLVNKRPLNNPTAPALTKMESQGLLNTIEVSGSSNSNKLVPDLSTIHKVLFQRK
ncbi:polymerase delta-interacting protein 3 isoform X1 [Tribolium castaneum]|uniref:polymerase delta-interacting protein 3 isoform X1 n=1 Tax=Tribolium castaneum TaxID=7070 RepID=UPI0001758789|nr:PREDICTED: polymerase delta-interacting protein 3 isoform X1 [Tribolium castaneum]|eukprot:XP_969371.2 PREDICTED: polymerase delta-interacting protein 3 isoform X1 [Tribolium castaneum]